MFKDLSNKYKFYVVLLLALLLAFASYSKSIKYTLAARAAYKKLTTNHDLIKKGIVNIQSLMIRSKDLDNLIGESEDSSEIINQNILAFASSLNNVSVSKLNKVHRAIDNDFVIYTYSLNLKGLYNNLANAIYYFEKEFNTAKITSIHYYKKKNHKTRKKELFVNLIFQNYEKK